MLSWANTGSISVERCFLLCIPVSLRSNCLFLSLGLLGLWFLSMLLFPLVLNHWRLMGQPSQFYPGNGIRFGYIPSCLDFDNDHLHVLLPTIKVDITSLSRRIIRWITTHNVSVWANNFALLLLYKSLIYKHLYFYFNQIPELRIDIPEFR